MTNEATETPGISPALGYPGDRVFNAALEAATGLGRLVRAGVLSPDNEAVTAAVVAVDGMNSSLALGYPGDRVFNAALEVATELGRLVRAGVLSPDNGAVAGAVVAADGLIRIRAGEPAPTRTDATVAAALLHDGTHPLLVVHGTSHK